MVQAASARRAGSAAVPAATEDAALHAMESNNDRLIESLDEKVGALKRGVQGMSSEIDAHNSLLEDMQRNMSHAQTGVGSALTQIGSIVEGGGGTAHMCQLVTFMVVIFLIIWWLFLR